MERRIMAHRDADGITKSSSILPHNVCVQKDGKGSSRIILIGSDHGKRKQYFEQAAREAGICCSFYDWKDIRCIEQKEDLKRCVVKIDAPEWNSCRLNELDALTKQYEEGLLALSRLKAGAFWNHPLDIAELLDKQRCKKRLALAGVTVTEMYEERFSGREELFGFLRENRLHQVFLKPVKGSGAAGVTALRASLLPTNGRIALYTCAALEQGGLVNTKRMYRLEGADAEAYLDHLLKLDCVVEKWYPKSTFQKYCYDLRVIVQDRQIDYILPRLSKGPITNLQLNNHSMEFEALHLDETEERITELCIQAANCYPRLHGIGMDVLLEQGSGQPYIIELNAQGDLLHRDVYGENRIYRRQVELMREMLRQIG